MATDANIILLGPDLTADQSNHARVRVIGPCSIFIEGGLGGGTVTIKASRTSTSTQLTLTTATDAGIINDAIVGAHYLEAELSGASAATLTVAVNQ